MSSPAAREHRLTDPSVLFWGVLAAALATAALARVGALAALPLVADEPDDLALMFRDLQQLPELFTATSAAPDQGRLPHLVSLPLIWLWSDHAEHAKIAVRALFLCFHGLYLLVSFLLVRRATGLSAAAGLYVALLLTSTYLASFSIFALTTSDGLYLLFHILTVYVFYTGWLHYREQGVYSNYVLLAVLVGLCTASKLFGVFLLVALAVFDLAFPPRRWTAVVRSVPPARLLLAGVVFAGVLAVINLVPVQAAKLPAAAAVAVAYAGLVAFWAVAEHRKRFEETRAHKATYWAGIAVTAFGVTLVASPIYLNLSNVLEVFRWPSQWSSGPLVADSHWWDISTIVGLKYGIVSGLAAAVPVAAYLVTRRTRDVSAFAALTAIIIAVHLVVVSVVKHKVTWYPLAVFPFLYLPWVWLFRESLRTSSAVLKAVTAALILTVVADNLHRYVTWYPYGHFDGAQYGREHIGWNRAGLVSFEFLPLLDQLLIRVRPPEDRPLLIGTRVVDVPRYNEWITRMLNARYRGQFASPPRFHFVAEVGSSEHKPDLVISSPVYNPGSTQALQDSGHDLLATLSIKTISGLQVWKTPAGQP